MSGGRSRQLGELREGDDEHRSAERDEPVADPSAREVGADAHEEEHAGEEHRDPDVVVGGLAGGHACGERLVGLLVQRLRLIESRLSVLGHVGRAARRGWVRLRVGGPPGVERDRELGTEASLRNRHRLLIIGHVGVEPGLKGGQVEVPVLPRVEVGPARVRPRLRGQSQQHSGLAVPLRRRIARPGRRQSDQGEENRFRDGEEAVAPVAGIVAPAVLGVVRELLPDLCPGQPFGHAAMLSARFLRAVTTTWRLSDQPTRPPIGCSWCSRWVYGRFRGRQMTSIWHGPIGSS